MNPTQIINNAIDHQKSQLALLTVELDYWIPSELQRKNSRKYHADVDRLMARLEKQYGELLVAEPAAFKWPVDIIHAAERAHDRTVTRGPAVSTDPAAVRRDIAEINAARARTVEAAKSWLRTRPAQSWEIETPEQKLRLLQSHSVEEIVRDGGQLNLLIDATHRETGEPAPVIQGGPGEDYLISETWIWELLAADGTVLVTADSAESRNERDAGRYTAHPCTYAEFTNWSSERELDEAIDAEIAELNECRTD